MKRRRRLALLVTGLVVAGLVAAVIAVVRFTADRVVWSAAVGAPADPMLAWLTDDLVVSAAENSRTVIALAKDDGSVRWTYNLPSGVICAASKGVLKGGVALAYGTGCRSLLLLDLGSGKPRWKVSPPGVIAAVEVADGRVTGALQDYDGQKVDAVAGFDADTGARRWLYQSECQQLKLRTYGNGFAGSRQRVAFAATCTQGESQTDEVRMLDTATGRQLYRLQLEPAGSDAQILTPAPLVVYQTTADPTAAPEVEAVQGLVQNIGGAPGLWSPSTFWVGAHPGQRIEDHSAVLDHRFMVVEDEADGWAAWDLNGGRDRWRRERITAEVDGDQVSASGLIRTSGEGILVTAGTSGSVGKPGRTAVLRLNPLTGEATAISPLLDIDPAQPGVWFVDGRRAFVLTGPGRVAAYRIS
jgi:putative pyrroloquinoline-quinone binding quinoprotein